MYSERSQYRRYVARIRREDEEKEMSMFICAMCGAYADSDDGCEELENTPTNTKLICEACAAERQDRDDEPVNPNVDMSYEGIKSKLLAMGCPPDIAEELAREKSR